MKTGDIVEWRGVCRIHHGTLSQSEEGEWIVRMDNGCTFSLNDVGFSDSAKLIEA